MDECRGVPLRTVIETMSSSELDHIADQLLGILIEMRSYTSTTLGSFTGGPYNNRFMPYPWNPPQAFSSVKEYVDYYRSLFLNFCGEEYVNELVQLLPHGHKSLPHPRRSSPSKHYGGRLHDHWDYRLGDRWLLSRVLEIFPDA